MADIKPIANKNSVIDLNDFFRKVIFHWPLLIIVSLIAIAGALLYLKYKKPMYLSSTKLYLKDEKKPGGEEMDMLKSLSLFNNNKNIENEMEVLKSPILLEKAIQSQHFNIRYYKKRTVTDEEMYDLNPLKIILLSDSSNVGNYVFDVTPGRDSLKIKFIDEDSDRSSLFRVKSGQPFSMDKDKFSIVFDPQIADVANTTFRIVVDSIMDLAYKKIEHIGTSLVNKDATVVLVTYEDPVADRAARFLNALLETYNQYTLDDKNKVALKTINFLSVRIDSLREELGLLERQEESFKVQRGITDIDASSKLALEQVKDADVRLSEANMQLSVVNQVESYINSPGSNYPFAPVTPNVDQTLTSMINRYEEGLKEKRRLSLSLQPGSSILQNLDAQITDSRNTIRNYIAGYKRNAGVIQKNTQVKVNEIMSKIANIPAYEREYINIKRQQGVKENLYLYLLKKKEEASVSYASNVTDNKIIAPAFVPKKPITPRKSFVFISFLAVALLISIAYVYLKYFLNPRVLTKKEIEQVFDFPVMAEVFQQHDELPIIHEVSAQNRSIIQEQIFNLRTNLKFVLAEQNGAATVMITSSVSGEGKTFISAHLANALTVGGKKVVLVEMDLRKPKLSRSIGQDNTIGLTNYIIGNKTAEEIIKKIPDKEGLYLVSSGPIPPNPVELIEGKRMTELLVLLKERFDYIIIDISPIGIVSDAKSISPYVDCTLFVVRYNFTLKSRLVAVAENLNEVFRKKKGIIFNGIEQDAFHPYDYYDHYGYSSNGHNKAKGISIFKKIKRRIA
jgi:capsular exopolysaccharide synthesis family protein